MNTQTTPTNKRSDISSDKQSKVQVPLRILPEQKEELEAVAKKEKRSISFITLRRYKLGCEAEKQEQLV